MPKFNSFKGLKFVSIFRINKKWPSSRTRYEFYQMFIKSKLLIGWFGSITDEKKLSFALKYYDLE
jgi:hypothetical protein